ncbi:MAG: MTH1187 family thiamine-binding protein [Thermoplasmata archaeon]
MIAEFSVVPIGKGESVSRYVAECMKLVEESGIAYKMNPMGTVLEGDYDEVMSLIRRCHMRMMEMCPRVITTVKIDDRKGKKGMLESKIRSVERHLGKKVEK